MYYDEEEAWLKKLKYETFVAVFNDAYKTYKKCSFDASHKAVVKKFAFCKKQIWDYVSLRQSQCFASVSREIKLETGKIQQDKLFVFKTLTAQLDKDWVDFRYDNCDLYL